MHVLLMKSNVSKFGVVSEIYCANIEQYRYSGGGQDLENRTVHIKHSPFPNE